MIDNGSYLDVLRILVLIQAAIAITSTVEALVVGVALGALGPAILTGLAAATTLVVYARLGRRSRRAHTALKWLQIGWIFFGLLDLVLVIILLRQPLELVAMLVRFVLPYFILRFNKRTRPAKTKRSIEPTLEPSVA